MHTSNRFKNIYEASIPEPNQNQSLLSTTPTSVCVTRGHAMGSEDTLYQDDHLFTLVRYCRADQPNYLQQ